MPPEFCFLWPSVSSLTASACVGRLKPSKPPQPQPVQQEHGPAQASLEEQLSDAGHDREVAHTEIAQRDKMITDLRRQLARQSAEIRRTESGADPA